MSKLISLYVHIPFCVKRCLFCSFAVSIGQGKRADEYLTALAREGEAYKNARLKTIYLGGGTPSTLSAEQLQRLVGNIRTQFDVSDVCELCLEINPEGVDAQKAQTLKSLGFNRVSLGVQSFNDAYLKFLGRAHNRAMALRAFEILRHAGFDNINVDVMYGFPGQTHEELRCDLESVVKLGSEHVSIYTLTIEPNSRFYAQQMKLDSAERLAEEYVFVTGFLESAGLAQYEVSNFAKVGFESCHNLGYWNGGEYLGLGMGAHSFLDNARSWNISSLKDYLESIQANGQALEGREDLPQRTRLMERLIFGLRMNQGVDVSQLEQEVGLVLPTESKNLLDDLIKEGFLTAQGKRIKTSMQGRLVLDEIARRLI